MILAAHTFLGFLNKSQPRIRVGARIFLSENDPKPKLNGPVLTIANIIKSVMASSAKSGIAALYITPKNITTYGVSYKFKINNPAPGVYHLSELNHSSNIQEIWG